MESTYLYDANDGTLRHDSTFPRGHAGRVIVGGLRTGRSVYRADAELPPLTTIMATYPRRRGDAAIVSLARDLALTPVSDREERVRKNAAFRAALGPDAEAYFDHTVGAGNEPCEGKEGADSFERATRSALREVRGT